MQRVERDQWQIQLGVTACDRQAFVPAGGWLVQLDGERESCLRDPGTPHNSKTPHLQKPRKRARRPRHALINVDPIIRHQGEPDIQ